MFLTFILIEINLIYSLALTLTIVDSLFVSIGEYPEHLDTSVNYPECGLKFVSNRFGIHFNDKCFKNNFRNKTFFDNKMVTKEFNDRKDRIRGRVVFGQNAGPSEAPWAVYLSYKVGPNEHNFCSGVLITFEWVLTAAHCYDNSLRTKVTANVGNNQRKGLKQVLLDKSKWFRHPDYLKRGLFERNDIRFDVSLVKLRKKLTPIWNQNKYIINTICLPNKYQINEEEDSAVFFGYGVTNDNGKISQYLQRAKVRLAPFGNCGDLLVCANYSGFDPRTCFGDSGGGLVQFIDEIESRAILIGSLIGGIPDDSGCSQRIEYDFFITISYIIDWILETIHNN